MKIKNGFKTCQILELQKFFIVFFFEINKVMQINLLYYINFCKNFIIFKFSTLFNKKIILRNWNASKFLWHFHMQKL